MVLMEQMTNGMRGERLLRVALGFATAWSMFMLLIVGHNLAIWLEARP